MPPDSGKRIKVSGIVGDSPAIRSVLRKIEIVAKSHSPVLLRGESGTGKELFARAIHEMSPRADGPFIKIADAIEASLASRAYLWVLRVATVEGLPQACRVFVPDFIIADLTTVSLASLLECVTRYPGVSVLGMESTSDRVLAVSCDQFAVHSTTDLTRAIGQSLHRLPAERGAIASTLAVGGSIHNRYGDAVHPHLGH